MGVIRTLFDRKDRIVTEDDGKQQEGGKVVRVLKNWCGYPQWTFKKVQDQMKVPKNTKKQQNVNKKVIVPTRTGAWLSFLMYNECLNEWPESTSRTVLQLPWDRTTLHKELVHPIDKRDPEIENITVALYECPCTCCMNCELSYIGDTGRKFGTRLEERKAEVQKVCNKVITSARRKESLTTTHKSAITDHNYCRHKPCHRLGRGQIHRHRNRAETDTKDGSGRL